MKPKPPIPAVALGASGTRRSSLALVLFYGLFTPFWFGLRSLAWLAEFRARRRTGRAGSRRGQAG